MVFTLGVTYPDSAESLGVEISVMRQMSLTAALALGPRVSLIAQRVERGKRVTPDGSLHGQRIGIVVYLRRHLGWQWGQLPIFACQVPVLEHIRVVGHGGRGLRLGWPCD